MWSPCNWSVLLATRPNRQCTLIGWNAW
jgi:hypothetical protein